jgi:Cyclin, N-terminal domain
VAEEQNCEEQVFPLAVNLLDRFLAASFSASTPVGRCQLQLLGCVCLLTASKLRQCRPIGVDLLVYYTDHSVTADEIRVSLIQSSPPGGTRFLKSRSGQVESR